MPVKSGFSKNSTSRFRYDEGGGANMVRKFKGYESVKRGVIYLEEDVQGQKARPRSESGHARTS